MEKRGAISTKHSVLLILIIIVTILVIVMIVFKGAFLQKNSSLLSKVDLDLKIKDVTIVNNNSLKVTIKCNKAQENLIGMRLVFEKSYASETVDVEHSFKEGEEAEFTVPFEKITSENLASVKLYPIMELDNGELSVGSIKDEYTRFYN
jgi:hypothetical protein